MNATLKRRFIDQILVMFGKEPSKPNQPGAITERAVKAHELKRLTNKADLQVMKAHMRAHEEKFDKVAQPPLGDPDHHEPAVRHFVLFRCPAA